MRLVALAAFAAVLAAAPAHAAPIVRCEGDGVTAVVDQTNLNVFTVKLLWSGGTGFNFQTNGVVRSDRGFASMGTRGLVYRKNEKGELAGWVALGGSIIDDLTCEYLN